ncbi:hypothetical protein KJ918_03855, partial [Patescibacteria group bacterium]|nr:hypothetical protein [Patescibacteria group bacterium]
GSGGSIHLIADTIAGSGSITADGGNGGLTCTYSGNGAGGRISLAAITNSFIGTTSVSVGTGGNGGSDGTFNVTILNSAPNTPIIDNFNTGTWITDNTPSLQFDLSDPNSGDIVKYQIQIDDDSDFLSLVVDYTEGAGSAEPRNDVTYTPTALDDGQYYWRVKTIDDELAESEWAVSNGGAVAFGVDTIAPTDPNDLISTSHTVSVWSNDNTVDLSWTAGTDTGGSGVDGYSYLWDTSASTVPDDTKDIEESVTTLTSAALDDGNAHYFHIRTVDNVGNWTSTLHLGPFYIDTTVPKSIQFKQVGEIEGNKVTIEVDIGDELSGVKEYMVSENPDFSGASWQPFTGAVNITLSTTEGSVTLYFKFRDEAGNESKVYTYLVTFELPDTGTNLSIFLCISAMLLLNTTKRLIGKSRKKVVIDYTKFLFNRFI